MTKIKIQPSKFHQTNRYLSRRKARKIVRYIAIGLTRLHKIVSKVLGLFTLIVCLVFLFIFFSALFGISFLSNHIQMQKWINLILQDGQDFYLGLIGLSLFVCTPILMLIYKSLKAIFNFEYHKRWINFIAGLIWLLGFFILLYVSFRTGKDFNQFVKVREFLPIIQKDRLFITVENVMDDRGKKIKLKNEFSSASFRFKLLDTYKIGEVNNNIGMYGFAKLKIIKSQTKDISLLIIKEAYGKDRQSAIVKAKNIVYNIKQQDSLLIVDELFKVKDDDKFRIQDLYMILKLPLGKVVCINHTLKNVLYETGNISDFYSSDLTNKCWIMTEKGLVCLDCQAENKSR